jgi:hypothetical protein
MKWFRPRRQPRRWKVDDTGGTEARQRAEVNLERVRAETREWERLGAELREIRRRNHLAETFLQATRGKP